MATDRMTVSRSYPAYPFLAVSIAVFRDDRVLLASRIAAPFEGAFSLPGGIVETGETLEEAALRELREEVQVEARILAFNSHVETIERDEAGKVRHHFVIASFIGEWMSGQGTPGPEAGAIVWADRDTLASLRCTPHILGIIESARAKLNGKL
jgi:ADP-ribose pyrophosphatase YjhB (NUDIX family)